MRRIVGVLLLVGVLGGAFGYRYYDERQRRVEEERQREARRAALTRLEEFVRTTGSSTGWEHKGGEEVDEPLERMLTVDLEREWLGERPVLFVGAVSDVATAEDRSYRVFVEYRPLIDALFLSKVLRLEVDCARERLDPVINARRRSSTRAFDGSGVAVAARIQRVRRELTPAGEGERTVLTGVGTCIDVLYIESLSDVGRRGW